MNTSILAEWYEKKEYVDHSIQNAERYLELENGVNWIPKELSNAIYLAIEGWLRQKNIKPNLGNGWHSMADQFLQTSENLLSEETSYLLQSINFLEIELLGDSFGDISPLDFGIENWKRKAYLTISRTKKLIQKIENDLLLLIS